MLLQTCLTKQGNSLSDARLPSRASHVYQKKSKAAMINVKVCLTYIELRLKAIVTKGVQLANVLSELSGPDGMHARRACHFAWATMHRCACFS